MSAPKELFMILGSCWRDPATGKTAEVNGWAYPSQECILSDGSRLPLQELMKTRELITHRSAQ